MKISIDYSDGRWYWTPEKLTPPGWRTIEVPESTVAMWEAAARLDQSVQDQLRALDDDQILEGE